MINGSFHWALDYVLWFVFRNLEVLLLDCVVFGSLSVMVVVVHWSWGLFLRRMAKAKEEGAT
jgi:hypothetical protein